MIHRAAPIDGELGPGPVRSSHMVVMQSHGCYAVTWWRDHIL